MPTLMNRGYRYRRFGYATNITFQLNKMAILKETLGQNERNVKISIRTQRILQTERVQ